MFHCVFPLLFKKKLSDYQLWELMKLTLFDPLSLFTPSPLRKSWRSRSQRSTWSWRPRSRAWSRSAWLWLQTPWEKQHSSSLLLQSKLPDVHDQMSLSFHSKLRGSSMTPTNGWRRFMTNSESRRWVIILTIRRQQRTGGHVTHRKQTQGRTSLTIPDKQGNV